jgi:hypothetical protein
MMLYQVVKLFGVWGIETYYHEEGIMKVSRLMWMGVGWAWACVAVGIGNFGKSRGAHGEVSNCGKRRGATVECGKFEKKGLPWSLVIWKKERSHREVW